MATSRTPNAQPRLKAQRLSVKVRDRFASRSQARGDNRRPRFTLIEAGLIVLVVLTTLAIASVSVWWVPVYLALLVTIFNTPRVRQSPPSASESNAASNVIVTTDLGQGLRVDRVDEAEQYRLVTRSDTGFTTTESAESLDPTLDPTGADTAKPRRGRVRARKASKPAAELVAEPLPVAWIQVGPGKFIRIEGGTTAANSAQTEEVTPRNTPAAETLTVSTPAVGASRAAGGTRPLESLETSPCDVKSVLVCTDCASAPVTEEHGIAPSTFSLVPRPNSATEGLDCNVPDRIDYPEIEAHALVDPAGQVLPSTMASGRLWLQPGTSRLWVSRVQPADRSRGSSCGSSVLPTQHPNLPKPPILGWILVCLEHATATRSTPCFRENGPRSTHAATSFSAWPLRLARGTGSAGRDLLRVYP